MTTNVTSSGSWLHSTAHFATMKIKFVKIVVVLATANTIAQSSVILLLTSSAEFVAVQGTWLETVRSTKTRMLRFPRPNPVGLLEADLIPNMPA